MNTQTIIGNYGDTYLPGQPTWGWGIGSTVDREVCDDSTCDECGHKGLTYLPFVDTAAKSYVAIAECPKCKHAVEF